MGGLRRLYAWVLSWAQSPWGPAALFVLAFVESSFFPIPPDPLLIALCLGAVTRSWMFALNCTIASVLGGMLGYVIGMTAFDWVGLPILEFYGKVDDFERYRELFRAQGDLAVFVAALTPVPYKLVTITAGAADMNVPGFVLASIVGRGARFFAVAGLIWWRGEQIAGFIERHFEKLSIAFAVLLVGGFVAFRFLFDH
ncbi:MAG: DedA family protein [Alphaproteobacteria bacterium]|nr:DedA family protein [Alphaproteobacteria bacterium]